MISVDFNVQVYSKGTSDECNSQINLIDLYTVFFSNNTLSFVGYHVVKTKYDVVGIWCPFLPVHTK